MSDAYERFPCPHCHAVVEFRAVGKFHDLDGPANYVISKRLLHRVMGAVFLSEDPFAEDYYKELRELKPLDKNANEDDERRGGER